MDFVYVLLSRVYAGVEEFGKVAIISNNRVEWATIAAAAYSLNAAAGTPTGYAGGKFYTAADTIDVVTVNAADTAVMSLTVVMVDCS